MAFSCIILVYLNRNFKNWRKVGNVNIQPIRNQTVYVFIVVVTFILKNT